MFNLLLLPRGVLWKSPTDFKYLPDEFIAFVASQPSKITIESMVRYDMNGGESNATIEQIRKIRMINYLSSAVPKPQANTSSMEVCLNVRLHHPRYNSLPKALYGSKEERSKWKNEMNDKIKGSLIRVTNIDELRDGVSK